MTVIAAAYDTLTRQGVMVADGVMTDGFGIARRSGTPKIRTFEVEGKRPWLLGLAGMASLLRAVEPLSPVMPPEEWLWRLNRDIRAKAADNGHTGTTEHGMQVHEISLMLLTEDGLWTAIGASDVNRVHAEGEIAYAALGSGREIAIGSLYTSFGLNASLDQRSDWDRRFWQMSSSTTLAVHAACKFSIYCGKPIQVESTEPTTQEAT